MSTACRPFVLALAVFTVAAVVACGADLPRLEAVPLVDVKIGDGFWASRIETTCDATVPHCLTYCEELGKIDNFRIVAGKKQGKFRGAFWEDSDLVKVIEGASYCLYHKPDPALDRRLDEIIAIIAAVQDPSGYVNTYFTLVEPKNRWQDECKHETYCAGHLIEAAVAHHQITGKRAFLDVATRLADHMCTVFGPGKQTDVPNHAEVELALVKLWRATGQQRYLDLARFWVDGRGHYEGRRPRKPAEYWGEYCQDDRPIREQRGIAGHAVRAMYFYSGATDLASLSADAGYLKTLDSVWRDVTERKMYITGGIGPSGRNEGFTTAYDLPNETAYCETCASIGVVFWGHRMTLLHGDARYADVAERALYNGAIAGVSLDGKRFFYTNPLASTGKHHRIPFFGCACCPTNIVRFIPAVGGYAYAVDRSVVYVNHYMPSTTRVNLDGKPLTLVQETSYPWSETVTIRLPPQTPLPMTFTFCLRIPGWCEGATIKLNGRALGPLAVEQGYARIARTWSADDLIELSLPMPVRRVYADSRVKADTGRVAIQRGPIVYAVEGIDHGGRVHDLVLSKDSPLRAEYCRDLLGGVVVVRGKARAIAGGQRSSPGAAAAQETRDVQLLAVPYFAWDNRAAGEMAVWLPEDPASAAR
jgi:DUF1680 family protein